MRLNDSIRYLITGLFVLSGTCLLCEEADNEIDCDSLPESKQALCKLLKQCSAIDNESTRQRCYELALTDEMLDEEGNLPSDIEELLNSLQTESKSAPSKTDTFGSEPELDTIDGNATETDETQEKQRKRRGLFGRLAGAVTAPVRALLPGDDNSTKDSDSNKIEPNDTEENEQTERWEATIKKVGRVDRNVHLILLDDGNLFEYIAPSDLRFRKNDKVEVIHVQTWLTEKYRIDGNRGPIRDALLIPCDREDLKGTMKRKCKLMGLD